MTCSELLIARILLKLRASSLNLKILLLYCEMMFKFLLKKYFFISTLFLLFTSSVAFSAETLSPVKSPSTSVLLGGLGSLRDDVYSADLKLLGEFAPIKYVSVYGDFSYRFFSYLFDMTLHKARHSPVNMEVNGFNESYVGLKFFPLQYLGIGANWRIPPGDGSQKDKMKRLGIEPMLVYPLSIRLLVGGMFGYYTYFEQKNLQLGDELGGMISFVWKPFLDTGEKNGFQIAYMLLYRSRIQESENLNLDKPYRGLDDCYRGFRLKVDLSYDFESVPLGMGIFYEMNRGLLFGFETGHQVGLYLRSNIL